VSDITSNFDNVVCGLLVRSGRVLLVHRNQLKRWAPNRWDLPGGHVEDGESDVTAVIRELKEELGVDASESQVHRVAQLQGDSYDLRIFVVRAWSGDPENCATNEHDDLNWFTEHELATLTLADPETLEIIVQVLRDDLASRYKIPGS
jgi:8-oxo-dGTP pyrophosphatase MutT (NUDIX family)